MFDHLLHLALLPHRAKPHCTRPHFTRPNRTGLYAVAWLLACSCQSVSSSDAGATPAEDPAGPTTTAAPIAAPSSTAANTQVPPNPEVNDDTPDPDAPKPASAAAPKSDAKLTTPPKPAANEAKSATDSKATKTDSAEKTPTPAVVEPSPKEPPAIEKPCLAKSFKFAAVRSACEKGGVPQAKSLMKAWTNKGKEKGETVKCATCHDNQKTYTNKPTADADLRKLLDVIK